MILDIYSWVTSPWCFVYSVAATLLTRFSKIIIAYHAQIVESNISGVLFNLCKDISYLSHVNIVSLLISQSSVIFKLEKDFQRKGHAEG